MVYALATPTVLATDAGCHPGANRLLAVLDGVFRLTHEGVTHLGLHVLDADPGTLEVALRTAVEADDGRVTSGSELARVAAGGPVRGATLVTSRLGTLRDLVGFVVAEAAPWPDPPRYRVEGLTDLPASALGAVGAVTAAWAGPDLTAEDVRTLGSAWERTVTRPGTLVAHEEVHDARAGAVTDLCRRLTTADLGAAAGATWPRGEWAQAMHTAAWAAFRAGRLRSQLLAVLTATAAVAGVPATPGERRSGLLAVHALATLAVTGDLVGPQTRRVLAAGSGML